MYVCVYYFVDSDSGLPPSLACYVQWRRCFCLVTVMVALISSASADIFIIIVYCVQSVCLNARHHHVLWHNFKK